MQKIYRRLAKFLTCSMYFQVVFEGRENRLPSEAGLNLGKKLKSCVARDNQMTGGWHCWKRNVSV